MNKHHRPTLALGASRPKMLAKAAGVSLALFLAACGGGEAITTSANVAADAEVDAATAAAAENIGLLTSTADTVFDIEVLSVADGQITTLNDVVDGDRPVLLWFWSPH